MVNNMSDDRPGVPFDPGIDLKESTVRSFRYEFHDRLAVYVVNMLVRPAWSDGDLAIRFEDVLYFELVGGKVPRIYEVEYYEEDGRVLMEAKGFGVICARRARMLNAKELGPKQTCFGESGLTAEDFYDAFDYVAEVPKKTDTPVGETFPEKYLVLKTVEEFVSAAEHIRKVYLASPYCPEEDFKKGVDLEQCNSMQVAMYKRMLYDNYKKDLRELGYARKDRALHTYYEGVRLYDRYAYTPNEYMGINKLVCAAHLYGNEFDGNPARDFLAAIVGDADAAALTERFGADMAEEIRRCMEYGVGSNA